MVRLISVLALIKQSFPDAPELTEALEAAMATHATLHLSDLPHCIGLNFVGKPSSGKTTVLDLLEGLPFTYRTDRFTPKAFVSHYAGVSTQQLQEIDLLPRIAHKTILVPELGPIFEARREELAENIATLARVFDGRGYTLDTGAQGQRGYTGDYRFAWIGASTPLPHRTWDVLGKLGSRWVFFPVERQRELSDEELAAATTAGDYRKNVQTCGEMVRYFLEGLWDKHGGFGGITWDTQDDQVLLQRLAKAAKICANWRGLVQRQDEHGCNPNIIEEPRRLMATLYCIARGYALINERTYLDEEDIKKAEHIAFSSIPEDRRRILMALQQRGSLSGKDITGLVGMRNGCSKPTALNIMEELESLNAVQKKLIDNKYCIQLKER